MVTKKTVAVTMYFKEATHVFKDIVTKILQNMP